MNPDPVSYALCCEPRSGSNWFAQLLADAGLGYPEEHLRILTEENRLDEYPSYWNADPFATKVTWPDHLKVEFDELLPPGHQVWIFHRRLDVHAQARSYALAQKYRMWLHHEVLPPDASVVDEHLEFCRLEIVANYDCWENYFAVCEIDPVRTFYEELCEDPGPVIDRVRKALYE